jgi:SsrA-binding protein
MAKEGIKLICQNRKARHEYLIEDTVEAGLVLLGPEVKSMREGRANLTDGYAGFQSGEAWLYNVHISPYPHSINISVPDPTRPRKLLLTRRELRRLIGKTQERGFTLVPLRMYFKNGKAKVELALAKGKKLYDKRETMKQKTIERELRKQYKIR